MSVSVTGKVLGVLLSPQQAHESAGDAATVDLSGQCVGGSYVLIEPIGGGGTGTVWRALNRADGGHVAVKLLREDLMRRPSAVTRFVQERTILLRLRHRNLVRVRDLLTVGESLGLVMDLVEGGSLRGHLDESGTLPPAEAAVLLGQVASALAEAHRRGIVHRDLKPDNVLLDRTGPAPAAKLTDFGIARVLDAPGLTTPEVLVGTPYYMAPEVICGGRPTPATDVYAIGVVLYELITGRPPYHGGSSMSVLHRHVDSRPAPVEHFPELAWRVVQACMQKSPGRRPVATELVTTFRRLARELADTPRLPVLDPPVGRDVTIPAQGEPVASIAPSGAEPVAVAPARRWPGWRNRARFMLSLVVLCTATVAAAVPGLDLLGRWQETTSSTPKHAPTGSAPREGGAAPPSPMSTSQASGNPGAGGSAGSSSAPPVRLGAGLTSGPAVGVEVQGPWQCAETVWDLGHPTLAKPCHSVGDGVRMQGHMRALPGVQADVIITLTDAQTGSVVAGPHTCPALMFTDFTPEHSCGPFDARPEKGRRYVMLQRWQYTGRAILPGGSARGHEFVF